MTQTLDGEERVRHIFAAPSVQPGTIEVALCGCKVQIRQLHGAGVALATCPGCLALSATG